jgi:hypothetical protein
MAPSSMIGEIARVRIAAAGTNSLFGELVANAPSTEARLAAVGA